jgi:hypothetical protein
MGRVYSEGYQCFIDDAAILNNSLPRIFLQISLKKRTAVSILGISLPKNLNYGESLI